MLFLVTEGMSICRIENLFKVTTHMEDWNVKSGMKQCALQKTTYMHQSKETLDIGEWSLINTDQCHLIRKKLRIITP